MRRTWRSRLEALLLSRAEARLGRSHPDWARAAVSETAHLPASERLGWSVGCLVAGFRTAGAKAAALYTLALAAGVAAMAAYQWSADESLATLALACAVAALLTLLRPSGVWVSGLSVGLVVFGVNLFGTLTGVRPAYETHAHTVVHDLRWALLAAPVLGFAAAARWATARIRLTS